eukprot:bmy_16513T0
MPGTPHIEEGESALLRSIPGRLRGSLGKRLPGRGPVPAPGKLNSKKDHVSGKDRPLKKGNQGLSKPLGLSKWPRRADRWQDRYLNAMPFFPCQRPGTPRRKAPNSPAPRPPGQVSSSTSPSIRGPKRRVLPLQDPEQTPSPGQAPGSGLPPSPTLQTPPSGTPAGSRTAGRPAGPRFIRVRRIPSTSPDGGPLWGGTKPRDPQLLTGPRAQSPSPALSVDKGGLCGPTRTPGKTPVAPTDSLEFSKSLFGNSTHHKTPRVPAATWPSPKYPESFRLSQSLQELRDKLAFNEGKSSFPGKNVAAGKSVSMVLAPPFKETSPETKVVKNGKCRYLEYTGKSRAAAILDSCCAEQLPTSAGPTDPPPHTGSPSPQPPLPQRQDPGNAASAWLAPGPRGEDRHESQVRGTARPPAYLKHLLIQNSGAKHNDAVNVYHGVIAAVQERGHLLFTVQDQGDVLPVDAESDSVPPAEKQTARQVDASEEGVVLRPRFPCVVLIEEDRRAAHLQADLLDALLIVDGDQEGLAAFLGFHSEARPALALPRAQGCSRILHMHALHALPPRTGEEISAPSFHPSWFSLCAICNSPESEGPGLTRELGYRCTARKAQPKSVCFSEPGQRSEPEGCQRGHPTEEGQGPAAEAAARPACCRALKPSPGSWARTEPIIRPTPSLEL